VLNRLMRNVQKQWKGNEFRNQKGLVLGRGGDEVILRGTIFLVSTLRLFARILIRLLGWK